MAYGTDSLDRARRGMEVFESELDTTIADTPFEVVGEPYDYGLPGANYTEEIPAAAD